MKRRRFNVTADGLLVDREGYVLGRVTSLTVEMRADVELPPVGGHRGVKKFKENSNGNEETSSVGGGVGEGRENAPVDEVWATYVEEQNPRRTEIDPDARRVIRDALKVATVVECQKAIRGNRSSSFHQGQNDRGKKYNAISQILKGKRGGRSTREQIDFFISLAERAGVSGVKSADPVRVNQEKAAIRAAWEFPTDDRVRERAQEAVAWLVEHGIDVKYREDGEPWFT